MRKQRSSFTLGSGGYKPTVLTRNPGTRNGFIIYTNNADLKPCQAKLTEWGIYADAMFNSAKYRIGKSIPAC